MPPDYPAHKKVEFEEPTGGWPAVKYYHEDSAPQVIKLVQKYSGGIIKSDMHAAFIVFGFIALAIVISIFFFRRGGGTEVDLPYEGGSNPNFRLNESR
jgi:hypothetical protein